MSYVFFLSKQHLADMARVALVFVLSVHLHMAHAFEPKRSQHCLQWVARPHSTPWALIDEANVENNNAMSEHASRVNSGAPMLCRRSTTVHVGFECAASRHPDASFGIRSAHLDIGVLTRDGACLPSFIAPDSEAGVASWILLTLTLS